jgi:hypothetical protein
MDPSWGWARTGHGFLMIFGVQELLITFTRNNDDDFCFSLVFSPDATPLHRLLWSGESSTEADRNPTVSEL